MITKPFTLLYLFFLGVTLLCCGCTDLVQEKGSEVNNSTPISVTAFPSYDFSNFTHYHGDEWSFIGENPSKPNPIYTYSFFQIVNDTLFFNNLDHNLYALDPQTREIKWKYPNVENPVISKKFVYFIHNGNVISVDPMTGTKRWNVTTNASILSTLQDGKSTIYFGRKDPDYLYALDALTGKEKWRSKTESFVSDPPVDDGDMVFFNCNFTNVYALNASTGTEIWRFKSGKFVSSPLMTDGENIYFCDNYTNLYALDMYTGEERWKFFIHNQNHINSILSDGVIYFGTTDRIFYSVNAQNGTLIWKNKIMHSYIWKFPFIESGIVYFGDTDGYEYALDARTGEKKWISHVDPYMVGGTSVISKEILYIGGEDGNIVAVNALNGSIIWNYETLGKAVYSTPLILNKWVYYTTKDGYLHALKVSGEGG
ncbi:PQQ-binding-like beta-propeller repeat protein [uncultured Methanospirillum sp.]|uniref:outer membrane protein assembly factor BamB family protein n=1 Tax=uncultured Methanospirillum sp. TaxID=262503 RepID=UPI0029C7F045|nr:PQQ-binding-like beta-propeller repeat protein [uncultured Methanospirillum sp.]